MLERYEIETQQLRSGQIEMIRLLIVEAQSDVRRGLRMRLALESDLAIIGEAGHESTALALLRDLHPDVILIDIDRLGPDGLATAKLLHDAAPRCPVVILTLQDNDHNRAEAQAAGAAAFVSKQGGDGALLAALRQAVDF